jgi:hypothetical protein
VPEQTTPLAPEKAPPPSGEGTQTTGPPPTGPAAEEAAPANGAGPVAPPADG